MKKIKINKKQPREGENRRFTWINITTMHQLCFLNVAGLGKTGLGWHFTSAGNKRLDRNVGNEEALKMMTC